MVGPVKAPLRSQDHQILSAIYLKENRVSYQNNRRKKKKPTHTQILNIFQTEHNISSGSVMVSETNLLPTEHSIVFIFKKRCILG